MRNYWGLLVLFFILGFLLNPLPIFSEVFAPLESPDVSNFSPYVRQEVDRLYQFHVARPGNADICEQLGKVLEKVGDREAGFLWFERAALISPTKEHMENVLKRATGKNQRRIGLDYAEKILGLDPENPQVIEQTADMLDRAGNQLKAAQLYAGLYKKTRKEEFLKKAVERYGWANHPAQALALMQKISGKRTLSAEFYEKVADVAEMAKKTDLCLEYLRKAIKVKPTLKLQIKYIERCVWGGKPADAKMQIEVLQRKGVTSAQIQGLYADVLSAEGQATATLAILDKLPAKELFPHRKLKRAILRQACGRIDEALLDAQSLLKVEKKKSKNETRFFAAITAGECAKTLGKAISALGYFRMALAFAHENPLMIDAKDAVYAMKKAAEAAKLAENPALEREYRQEILRIFPEDSDTLLLLAQLEKAGGQTDRAREHFEALLKIAPHREGERMLVDLLLETGHDVDARTHLENLLKSDPEDSFPRKKLLVLYRQWGDWDSLLPLVWREYRESPSREQRIDLSGILVKTGRSRKAGELLLQALIRDPFDHTTEKVLETLYPTMPALKVTWDRLKPQAIDALYQGQIGSLTAQLKNKPHDPALIKQRAEGYLWQGKPKKALDDLMTVRKDFSSNQPLLARAIDAAESAGDLPKTLDLRREFHHVWPQDASNTLNLARHLGWNQRQAEALSLYQGLVKEFAGNPLEVLVPAFPVYTWNGLFKSARKILRRSAELKPQMTPREKKEFARQEHDFRASLAPMLQMKTSFTHDSQGLRINRLEYSGRFGIEDRSRLESNLALLRVTNERFPAESFRGKVFESQLLQWKKSGDKFSLGLQVLGDSKDSTTRVMLPTLNFTKRSLGRETRVEFREDPVYDTSAALRRGITLKTLRLQHVRPLTNTSSLSLWAKPGKYSEGPQALWAGAAYEKVTHRNPTTGWRYIFSLHQSDGGGGEVFYTPSHVAAHQVQYFGEKVFNAKRYPGIRLDWMAYAGKQIQRASFYGVAGQLEGTIGRKWGWQMAGSAMKASQGTFVTGQGGYGSWDWSMQLQRAFW